MLDFKENNDSYHIEYTHGVNPPVFPFGILEKDCLVTYYIIFDGNILVSQNENISNIHYMYNIETETFYDVKDLYGSGWGLQSQYSTKWKTENFPTMDDIKNMSDNVKNLIIK